MPLIAQCSSTHALLLYAVAQPSWLGLQCPVQAACTHLLTFTDSLAWLMLHGPGLLLRPTLSGIAHLVTRPNFATPNCLTHPRSSGHSARCRTSAQLAMLWSPVHSALPGSPGFSPWFAAPDHLVQPRSFGCSAWTRTPALMSQPRTPALWPSFPASSRPTAFVDSFHTQTKVSSSRSRTSCHSFGTKGSFLYFFCNGLGEIDHIHLLLG